MQCICMIKAIFIYLQDTPPSRETWIRMVLCYACNDRAVKIAYATHNLYTLLFHLAPDTCHCDSVPPCHHASANIYMQCALMKRRRLRRRQLSTGSEAIKLPHEVECAANGKWSAAADTHTTAVSQFVHSFILATQLATS